MGRTSRREFMRGGIALAGLGLLAAGGLAERTATAARAGQAAGERSIRAAAALQPLDPAVVLRVGRVGLLAEAGQVIAFERGYFQEEGIRVEYSDFDSAARMVPSLGAGQLDVGGGTISAGLFNAVARGVGLKIVGPQARHDPGASALHLMVRRELVESGEVAEYADLRGRTIGVVARGTVVDFLAALALARGGLQLADAELVELPFPDMTAAMSNGAIDAAIQTEPTATLAATRGVAVKWREAADLRPGLQAAAVFFAPHFAQQIDLAQRWMAAYLRGVRDYNDAFKKNIGRTEVIDVLTRQTTVKDPALYDRMGVSHIDPDGRVDADSLAEQLDWYAQQGLLTQPIEVAQALDLSFADAAVERLGPYA